MEQMPYDCSWNLMLTVIRSWKKIQCCTNQNTGKPNETPYILMFSNRKNVHGLDIVYFALFLCLFFCSLYQMFLFKFSHSNYYVKYVFFFCNFSRNEKEWFGKWAGLNGRRDTCHSDYKMKNRRKYEQREWD